MFKKTSTLLTIHVYHQGVFVPKPLVYVNPTHTCITVADFEKVGFEEFVKEVNRLTSECGGTYYYCDSNRCLVYGLRELSDENDYTRFLDAARNSDYKINVYIDEHNYEIMKWIEDEKFEEGNSEDEELCEDDVDSLLSDDLSVDHEEDDEVIPIKSTDDPFLTRKNIIPAAAVEDEDDTKQKENFPIHDPNQQWDQMISVLGMRFSNREELKHLLSNYVVSKGYGLWYEKINATRLLVRCSKSEGKSCCPFRLWATWMTKEDSFQIKSLIPEHNCVRQVELGSMVTYSWIGKHLVNDILETPRLSYRKIKALVKTRFGLNVSVVQCRNATRYALEEIEGSLVGHYEKLRSYGSELIRANPGSTCTIDVDIMPDQSVYFSKMYVCLKGVKDGWIEGCRRVIVIDGCFLKGICRGELLSAVGRDANNQMYPIAWAVVGVENKATWKWFIDLLLEDLEMGDGTGLTIISDQHKGLVEAVKERAPGCEHRQCARHIYANFKKKFSGVEFRKLFWAASKSTTQQRFEATIREIRMHSTHAYDHLIERDPTTWCKAFFKEDRCCDAVENGISESFNAAIVEARKKPIITMLEEVRVYVMERMYSQKKKGQKWNLPICPSIRRRIEKMKEAQRYWNVIPSGPQQYEVTQLHETYACDLQKRSCGCRGWQLTGIPCVHAIASILFLNGNCEDHVAPWFTTGMFGSCYRYNIQPINGAEMWPVVECTTILPPKRRRMPGRPKVNRKKCPSEKETRHIVSKKGGCVPKCSKCNQEGHNKRRCPLLKQGEVDDDQAGVSADAGGVAEDQAGVISDAVGVVEDQAGVQADVVEGVGLNEQDGVYEDEQDDGVQVEADVGDHGEAEQPGQVHHGSKYVLPQHLVNLMRKRKYERLTKLNLKKKVVTKDGKGEDAANPVTLE